MKKLISLALALIMIMSLSVTAFAAETTKVTGVNGPASITVELPALPEGSTADNTYKIYKVFDATTSEDGSKISYTLTQNHSAAPNGFTVDTAGNVKYSGTNKELTSGDIAAIAAYVTEDDLVATVNTTATDTSFTVSGLPYGFYYINTTTGTVVTIDSNNSDATVRDKNTVPKVTKEVKENSTNEFGQTNDAHINEPITFKSVITVGKGAENYVFHDNMSEGLTFDGVTSVKVGNDSVDASNYAISTTSTCGCTFEIAFVNEYIATLEENTKITVEYTAHLNEKASIAGTGNVNEVKLQYGHAPSVNYTPVQQTVTYTYDLEVLKYANNDKAVVLEGVKFILLNENKTKIATVTNGQIASWTDFTADTTVTSYELITDKNGKICIDGLDTGTYYLRETYALPGYNKLTADIEANVEGTTDGSYATYVAEINNNSGTELPTTGGMGTTLFYILGALMVLGAVVILVTKKRMGAAE